MVAAKQWMMNGDTKGSGRRAANGKSYSTTIPVRELAKKFRTSDKTIAQARDLLQDAPDLAARVECCSLSLRDAVGVMQQRQRDAAETARRMERIAKFRELISDGVMSEADAWEKVAEEEQRARDEASCRRLWEETMTETHKKLADWVGDVTDERLAWYTEKGAAGEVTKFKEEHVDEMIALLKRVKQFTFGKRR
jgi:hypothetical protein